MIDKRMALSEGYWLSCKNDQKIQILYEVERGTTSIVYEANLYDSSEARHLIRMKELYPINLFLERNEDGALLCNDKLLERMENAKEGFRRAYLKGIELKKMIGEVKPAVKSSDIFAANNTLYIVLELNEGMDYRKYEDKSLVEVLKHIHSLAVIVKQYHDTGIINLNIRPENIFISSETLDSSYLSYFDSAICAEQITGRSTIELFYSEGYTAPEQLQGLVERIGPHTDIYAIGAILFFKIFNKCPGKEDCRISGEFYFDNMPFSNEKYPPEFYQRLSYFLHKTLSSSVKYRWSDINKVIDELNRLILLTTDVSGNEF